MIPNTKHCRGGLSALLLAAWLGLAALAALPARADHIPYENDGLGIPPEQTYIAISQKNIDLLGDALQHGHGINRAKLTRDLGLCGRGAEAYLKIAAGDADPAIRVQAANAIASVGDPAMAPALAPLLKDTDATVRREAVTAAGVLGDAAGVAGVLNSETDEAVLLAALHGASTAQHGNQIAGRLAKLPPRLQVAALAALGKVGANNHADAVAALVTADEIPVRIAAIAALAALKDTGHVALVIGLLHDPHPTIRRTALEALQTMAAVDVRQQCAQAALNDADNSLRISASHLLALNPTTDAIPALVKALDDEFQAVRFAARDALLAIGMPVQAPAVTLLENANPRRREDGLFLLTGLKSTAVMDRRIELLKDADWGVVDQAARSLYAVNPDPAVAGPAVVEMILRGEKNVMGNDTTMIGRLFSAQEYGYLTAGKIGYRPVLDIIRTRKIIHVSLLDTDAPPIQVRHGAIWAIGLLATPDDPLVGKLMKSPDDADATPDIIFECIKAVGNIGYKPAAEVFKKYATDPRLNASTSVRWISHAVYDRLTGQTTDYILPQPFPRSPEVSIQLHGDE